MKLKTAVRRAYTQLISFSCKTSPYTGKIPCLAGKRIFHPWFANVAGSILNIQKSNSKCMVQRVRMNKLFQLLDMEFVVPLPLPTAGACFILHFINYFSRFSITFFLKTVNASDVMPALEKVFIDYAVP